MFAAKASQSAPAFEHVIDVIQKRVDALSEKDLLPPEEWSKTGAYVGDLPIKHRKLSTLMRQLSLELEPLMKEHEKEQRFVHSQLGAQTTLRRLIDVSSKKDVQESVKRLEQIELAIAPIKGVREIVRLIFWQDVNAMFSCWEKNVSIQPDWSVRTVEVEEPDSSESILSRLFGR
ncbi:hypothetical protein JNK62_03595 [bacterium]|nr:hypothetical protein [bacterium]